MTNEEFKELATNDYRGALLVLFDEQLKLRAEQDATQATVVELSTEVNAQAA